MVPRSTNQIYVSDDFFLNDDIIKFGRTLNIDKAEKLLNDKFKSLVDEVQQLYDNNKWIEMQNKKVYFEKTENLIIPDLNKIKVGTGSNCNTGKVGLIPSFEGFTSTLISRTQIENIFCENRETNPFLIKNGNNDYRIHNNINCAGNGWKIKCAYYDMSKHYICFCDGRKDTYSNCDYSDIIYIPVFNLKSKSLLENLIEHDLVPTQLSENGKQTLKALKEFLELNYISIYDNSLVEFLRKLQNIIIENNNTSKILKDFKPKNYVSINSNFQVKILKALKDIIIENNNIPEILKDFFKNDNMVSFMKEYVKTNTITLTDDLLKSFGKPFLECDLNRADIEPYDLKTLTDINGGHWELWTDTQSDNKTKITVDKSLVGRNPVADVHWDGLVGIDFGTKSTVVAYQDGTDKTHLHRIGMGKLSKKAEPKHYENPTVMEFINLEDFMSRYNSSNGRPETLWNDLTVSHTAQNNLNESNNSDYFYSYFYDLKQWCGDTTSNRQLRIKDQNGHEKILPSFTSLTDEDFNPIEIYAYYLGLFINNMRNGIYIDYIMSFPVTYEKTVREKILDSFEKGLKKSMPNEILENEEVMSNFRVQSGTSEPACYAICALQQFNIEPQEDEQVFYSIFDFGGGTTDFDFGIWRLADENDVHEEDYDYVIKHFGAGGDQYLGGENLLELLSYEIFKANADILLTGKDGKDDSKDKKSVGYSFYKPTECDIFNGSEVLLSNSQEAKRNTKSLMEKLRPFMENLSVDENGEIKSDEKFIKDGYIDVDLFNKDGEMKTGVQLKLKFNDNTQLDLIKILEDRIEQGVSNFFQALINNFNRPECVNWKSVNIFLAGNSSKSPIVKKLFNKYIDYYTKEICSKSDLESGEFFKIFAPLGTEEANAIQKENGVDLNINDITRATGKTGVAYGLLDGRKGSNILVKSEVNATQEVPFKYYIGLNKKKKFKPIILKGAKYNEWVRLKNALTSDFYIYYSNLPMVENCETSIDDIKKKKCILSQSFDDESYSIYVRPTKPNVIEYAVATDIGIKNNDFIMQPKTLELII